MYAQWRSIDEYQAIRQDPAPLRFFRRRSRSPRLNPVSTRPCKPSRPSANRTEATTILSALRQEWSLRNRRWVSEAAIRFDHWRTWLGCTRNDIHIAILFLHVERSKSDRRVPRRSRHRPSQSDRRSGSARKRAPHRSSSRLARPSVSSLCTLPGGPSSGREDPGVHRLRGGTGRPPT
jgi:hypothetical protein